MTSLLSILNTLLPFTDPSRPLWCDILHTLLLCTFLYFGPQIRVGRVYDLTLWIGGRHEHADEVAELDESRADALYGVVEPEQAAEDSHAEGPGFVDADDHELDPPLIDAPPAADPDDAPNAARQRPATRQRDPTRAVGAKKAKSLARKDRQRAYNEFLREQGNAQRARDAEGAAEREQEAFKERERRKAIEERIQEQKAQERAVRKEKEDKTRREEEYKIATALRLIDEGLRGRVVRLGEVAKTVDTDLGWVQALVKREGYLGIKEQHGMKVMTMVTTQGYLVRIDNILMQETYRQVVASRVSDDDSDITVDDIGGRLERVLLAEESYFAN
jgi:hypothetical protein